MRISISLYHPHRGLQIAARTIEGPRAELFLLENQVLTSVREFLGLGGRPGGRPRPDPAARERYLQALGYLQRYDHQASVDGAVRLLEGLTAGDPENASYHAALGRAYLERYRLTSEGVWESRAAESCQRAMALAPESPDVLISLGELHLLAGRREQAIREFQAVLRTRPESAAAYNDLARAFEAMGRRPEAEQACRQAIALQPEYWAHYNRLGLIFFNGGRYGESAEAWQLALRLSPDNAMVCRNLAGALFRQDRLEESADMYRRSIQIEPTSGAFSYLGAALYWLGRRDEAIDALRTSVAMAPRDWSGWGTLGNAYRWTPGHESLAAEALDRAIALMRQRLERTPGSAKEWANFASVLANRGLDGEAATAIERAIALPDFDLNCMAIAGSVCHVLGRREEALRWLRQAVGLGYGTSRLQYNPALEGLRNDPEFKRILAGARSTPAGATPGTPGNNGGAT
jgi:tetratricopeptide (TPR) repeat protein